jgi:hypothetical protein
MAKTEATETPTRAKFVKTANQRVRTAQHALRYLSNVADKARYTYTAADAEAIVTALRTEVEAIEARFANGKAAARQDDLLKA